MARFYELGLMTMLSVGTSISTCVLSAVSVVSVVFPVVASVVVVVGVAVTASVTVTGFTFASVLAALAVVDNAVAVSAAVAVSPADSTTSWVTEATMLVAAAGAAATAAVTIVAAAAGLAWNAAERTEYNFIATVLLAAVPNGLGDHVEGAPALRPAFHPGSQIYIIAHHGVVEPAPATHIADHAFTGIQANSCAHLVNQFGPFIALTRPFIAQII